MSRLSLFLCVSALSFHLAVGQDQKDCSAPRDRGDYCSDGAQQQMFYFESKRGVCQPFMFNGCNGNGNRFATSTECREYCINGAGLQLMRDAAANQTALTTAMKLACQAIYDTDHLSPIQCNSMEECGEGHECNNGFCCPNADYLCNLRYESGKFAVGGVKSDKYFWTPQYSTCMRFSFYGSLGNANNFKDYNSCMRVCGSQKKN